MKNIRLKYQRDTGIKVQPEINLVCDYMEYTGENGHTCPFPYLYDYINWLEDQLNKTSAERRIQSRDLEKQLMKL